MAITYTNKSIAELNAKHRYLQHTRVFWERYKNKREIIQCKNCQRWGHATSNCHLKPRCVKCGADHMTRECVKPKDIDAKCANCNGAHTACNISCPVYTNLLEQRANRYKNKRAPKPAPRYLPAPPPSTNIWDTRRNKRNEMQAKTDAPAPPAQRSTPQGRPRAQEENNFGSEEESVPATEPHPTQRASQNTTTTRGKRPELNDLVEAINELDSLINIELMFERITKLNAMLRTCRNEGDRFQTFLKFYKTINGQH